MPKPCITYYSTYAAYMYYLQLDCSHQQPRSAASCRPWHPTPGIGAVSLRTEPLMQLLLLLAAAAAPVGGWRQDRFVISGLDAPPQHMAGAFRPGGTMDLGRRYAQLKQANFTLVLGQMATELTVAQPYGNTEDILRAAEAHGLKVLLSPLLPIDPNSSAVAQLASSLSNSTSPALWGWHLADEPPDVAHFKQLAAWKTIVDTHRPGKLSYVNLLPNSCVHYGPGPWGYVGYDGSPAGYLNQFITTVDPQVLSFDHYPYFEAADSGAMPTKDCPGCGTVDCATAQGDSTPSCCCCNCTRSGYRRSLQSHRLAAHRLDAAYFLLFGRFLSRFHQKQVHCE